MSVIDSFDRFQELSQAWNDLLFRSFSNNIFLTWEWLYAWSETYIKNSRRLFILKIEESGKLVGIAPWCIRRVKAGPFQVKHLEFLGAGEGGSDYLDVIVKRGREEEVSSLLFHYIFHQIPHDWDVLSLKEISSGSIFMKYLTNEFRKSGKHYEIEESSYCPTVALPQSVEEFDRGLSRNRRQQYNRHIRILEKNNDVQRFHSSGNEVIFKELLSVFKQLYENRWGNNANDLFHLLEMFLRLTKDRSVIDVDLLKVNGDYVGGLLHFNYNNIKYMYLMAVNKYFNEGISLGNTLCVMNIKTAIEEKCREYDFLKGEESYKFLWMNNAKSSYHLVHYRRTVSALAQCVTRYTKNLGKILLR